MDLLIDYMPGFLLTVVRVTAMLMAALFLGTDGTSRPARLILGLGLGVAIFLRHPTQVDVGPDMFAFAIVVARELVLGLALGFGILLAFMVLRTAGAVLSSEMGFALSQVMDPTTGISSPVMGRFFESMSMLYLLAVDGHHRILTILARSFDRIPVGETWDVNAMREGLTYLTAASLELAIQLASPIYATIILTTMTLIVLARIVPQVHLMDFAFALRILLSLLIMSWFFSTDAFQYLSENFDKFFIGVDRMLGHMAR
ncbi:MAG: flagellar biosynthetic protein FliR [Planctomycetota bacterium]